jgi:hypothetical protein
MNKSREFDADAAANNRRSGPQIPIASSYGKRTLSLPLARTRTASCLPITKNAEKSIICLMNRRLIHPGAFFANSAQARIAKI